MKQINLLYIVGAGRSGSTLLDQMLGQIDGYISCGELESIWTYGILENNLCACGKPFGLCPFWCSVIQDAYGDMTEEKIKKILSNRKTVRVRNLLKLTLPSSFTKSYRAELGQYLEEWNRLLHSILKISNGKVIIDSSKAPHILFALCMSDQINLNVIHLVRDSRGVVFSYTRRKQSKENPSQQRLLGRRNFLNSSLHWMFWNYLAQFFSLSHASFIRIRYEDLIRKPSYNLQRILEMLEDTNSGLKFIRDNSVLLERTHHIKGNPVRFKEGMIRLKVDDEWRYETPKWKTVMITILTFHLLRKYDYINSDRSIKITK